MPPCIQDFNLAMGTSRNSVSKIHHDGNTVADSLAKLAFSSPHVQSMDYVPGCTCETHCLMFNRWIMFRVVLVKPIAYSAPCRVYYLL
jgi:hypothetical protein